MNKIILVPLLVIGLLGCTTANTSREDVEQALENCKPHGGLNYLSHSGAYGHITAVCKDNTMVVSQSIRHYSEAEPRFRVRK